MQNATLNFLERNKIVNALREGKSWNDATAFLPSNIDRAALAASWKEHLTEGAKKDAARDPAPVKLDIDEFLRLRKENEEIKTLNDRLNKDLAALRTKVEEYEDLINDPKSKAKK
jgi:hypothetical protein